jgi:hypothetical protein
MTAACLDLDGAVLVRGTVARARVEAVADVVEAALCAAGLCAGRDGDGGWIAGEKLGGRGWDDPRWLQVQQVVLEHAAVGALREDEGLMSMLGALMGGTPRGAQGDIVRVACPGQPELTTPPHQDGYYITDADDVWTVWLPLVPCPLELGPLALIPGSHRNGLRPHAPCHLGVPALMSVAPPRIQGPGEISPPWFAAGMSPGDALLFRSHTIHGALPNRHERHLRVSIDLRYRASCGTNTNYAA